MVDSPDPTGTSITKTLTTVGMLLYGAWLIFFFRQLERVARVTEQRFAGEWDQRIEVMSFFILPPNALMILPPAIAASIATWMAGPSQQLELAILLRITRWSANVMLVIGVVSAVNLLVNDNGSPTRAGDVGLRIAGMLIAGAASKLCLEAGRTAPGG